MDVDSHITCHCSDNIIDDTRIGAVVFFCDTDTVEAAAARCRCSCCRARPRRRSRNIKHPFAKVGLYDISRHEAKPRFVKPLFRYVFDFLDERATVFINPRLAIVTNGATFFTNGVDDDGKCVAAAAALNKRDGDGLIKRRQ